MLAAPVSGNPSVVKAGRLTVVSSGPQEAFDIARPYLELFGAGVTYVGDGDAARLVKICHNLFLGVVAESMAEIAVLAERGGVPRRDFLEFLNQSVLGSTFTRYKTPAYVNRSYSPTFTLELLRKDFDLGLDAGAASSTSRCPPWSSSAPASRRRSTPGTPASTSPPCSSWRPTTRAAPARRRPGPGRRRAGPDPGQAAPATQT